MMHLKRARPLVSRTVTAALALALTAGVAATRLAAGLIGQGTVDAEALWVLHLDAEAFLGSTVGAHLRDTYARQEVEGISTGMRLKLHEVARLVNGITAYGGGFAPGEANDGVLVIRGEPRMSQMLEAMLISEEHSREHIAVATMQSAPYALYQVDQDSFVGFVSPTIVLASQSRALLERAREVIKEERPAATANTLPGGGRVPAPDGFFLFGAADGVGEQTNLPAKALITRMAELGRLAVGESDGEVYLVMDLVAHNKLVANQLQKVLQGILALASLTAYDAIDLRDYASRVNLQTNHRQVTLSFSLPNEEVVSMIDGRTPVQ